MQDILQQTFFQNTVLDYLIALAILVAGISIVFILKKVMVKRLKGWAAKTATDLDDCAIKFVEKNLIPLLYFGALYLAVQRLVLSEFMEKVMSVIGVVLVTLLSIRFLIQFINYLLLSVWLKNEPSESRQRSLKSVVTVLKFLVWSIGVIFLLDNLGFKVSTVIAGLGIGGVAVALAAQAVLGDLFSFFAILFDRPFEIGDFIIVGDYLGSVEYIGIKTTRIRSLGGEQLIFSNTDLTNSRVRNYKRMERRRVLFQLGVTYDTSQEKLQQIPQLIKDIIIGVEDTVFDRAHFSSYGDFNLVIEVVYYVIGPDYNKYMDIQQLINLAIKREFDSRGIEFAFPTQTIHLNKAG